MNLRTCTACHATHAATLVNFFPQKGCKFDLTPTCRACTNAMRRAWKERNSERLAARRRELYATTYGPRQRHLEQLRAERKPYQIRANILNSGIRDRCNDRGWPIPKWLTTGAVQAWLRQQPNCECCGVEFAIRSGGRGQKSDASPSFDQFKPGLGYERENVRLICWRCNNIKRNYAQADLRLVADWMDGVENDVHKFDSEAVFTKSEVSDYTGGPEGALAPPTRTEPA